MEKIEVKSDTEKTGVVSEMKVLESSVSSCVVNMLAEFSPWISELTQRLCELQEPKEHVGSLPWESTKQSQRVNIQATNAPGVYTYVDEQKAEQNASANSSSSWANSYALTEGWTKLAIYEV